MCASASGSSRSSWSSRTRNSPRAASAASLVATEILPFCSALDDADPVVAARPFRQLGAHPRVRAGVVDEDQLPVRDGLADHAQDHRPEHVDRRIVHGDDDGESRHRTRTLPGGVQPPTTAGVVLVHPHPGVVRVQGRRRGVIEASARTEPRRQIQAEVGQLPPDLPPGLDERDAEPIGSGDLAEPRLDPVDPPHEDRQPARPASCRGTPRCRRRASCPSGEAIVDPSLGLVEDMRASPRPYPRGSAIADPRGMAGIWRRLLTLNGCRM